jgi:hypothetical protein
MDYKLTRNQRVKEDIEKYTAAVGKITNNAIKRQYEILLKDFKKQIQLIDEGHSTYNNGYIDPRNNRENVERLISIRTKLDKLIK